MSAYISIVGPVACYGFELTDDDLSEIGEFTKEKVSKWIKSSYSCCVFEAGWMESPHAHSLFQVAIYGCDDFHAVCGDIDIPWAKEESKLMKNGG
jgi:hypothetical protein